MIYLIPIIIFLILLNGFFAGVETSFLSLDLFFIEIKTEKKHKFSLLYYILKKPHLFITTTLIGTNITLIALTQILSKYMNQHLILNKIFLYFIFPFLILIFCEIYPKIIFSRYSYNVSKIAVYPFVLFQLILSPVVLFFNIISKILEFLFIKDKAEKINRKENEIKNILASSLKKKLLSKEFFIEDAIKFDEISISDIQKPIFSLPVIILEENEIIDLTNYLENWQKNYAIYNNKNEFIGILNLNSIFNSENIKKTYNPGEIPIIKNIPVIYEGKNLLSALELMIKTKSSFLITINEFGQTSGIITKEDMFSHISNTIMYRNDLLKYDIKKVGEKSYIVSGFTELTNLSRTIGINIKDDYYHTFNGFLIHKLGKIPKEGEIFILDNKFEVRILSSTKKYINKAWLKIVDS